MDGPKLDTKFIFILVLLQLTEVRGQVVVAPRDTAGVKGESVTLVCEIDTATSLFEWKEYNSDVHGSRVYASTEDEPDDPEKYRLQDETSLVVQDLELYDGGMYGCKTYSDTQFFDAKVVVLEKPTLDIPELMDGVMATINCMASYGGPSPDDMPNELKPKLKLFIDGRSIEETETLEVEGQPGTRNTFVASQMKLTKQYTFRAINDGKDITCEISSLDASESATEIAAIKHGVNRINVYPESSFHQVGESIECSAQGNPEPQFRWTAIVSPDPTPVNSKMLEITEEMLGQNRWTCTASNNAGGVQEVSTTIAFEVLEAQGSTGGSSSLHRRPSTWAAVTIITLLVITSTFQ